MPGEPFTKVLMGVRFQATFFVLFFILLEFSACCICYFKIKKPNMVVLISKKERQKEKERRKENGKEGGKKEREKKRRIKKESSVIVRLTACLRMFVIWISLLNSHTWAQRLDKNIINLLELCSLSG